ncbi:Biotin synthase [Pseudovibrio axinellae]|uniref:Biotin synthase n=1 Tax=Pseudovibrio axinellae TaxID=989403 RepID=A0A165XII8_9HYPH|nr:biotin synthase BioB [Pseudovibrio axinellae]KZL17735.1 Biotin synthase [Pseudovibrio axinellae]SER41858.1 biotin synthase [Pseudovibrio axinellae]
MNRLQNSSEIRNTWTREEAEALYNLPFNDLLFKAHCVHREHFDPNEVQQSQLLSIKTGGCPEDCSYCSQSARNNADLPASKLLEVQTVLAEAKKARDGGATRYCMGAAWRSPKDRDMRAIEMMVEGVKELGMESCMTLGMLTPEQILRLKDAGLDYYNHNIDTSERYYSEVISTRKFSDRLETLNLVKESGIKVCSGGIVGMGEENMDRLDMLVSLATLEQHPDSVPINMLIPIEGTPLQDAKPVEPIEFVRLIAVARIMMPKSHVRLSAGRTEMSIETQAMCFFAGANSVFKGETLLTADNPEESKDAHLFKRLGIRPMALKSCTKEAETC